MGVAAFLESCKSGNSVNPQSQGPSANFTIDLTQSANASLNSNGGSIYSNGVIVTNINGTYVALAQACTHQGCSISYNQTGNDFICPCHNGVYDTNGNVLSGPPPASLKKYSVTKSGSILTVSG